MKREMACVFAVFAAFVSGCVSFGHMFDGSVCNLVQGRTVFVTAHSYLAPSLLTPVEEELRSCGAFPLTRELSQNGAYDFALAVAANSQYAPAVQSEYRRKVFVDLRLSDSTGRVIANEPGERIYRLNPQREWSFYSFFYYNLWLGESKLTEIDAFQDAASSAARWLMSSRAPYAPVDIPERMSVRQ